MLVLAGILAWQLGWFRQPAVQLDIGRPGSATGPAASFRLDSGLVAAMQSRMVRLLWHNDGGLANWYQLASRTGQPPAARSGQFLAENQLRYGQFLLEQGDEKSFRTWWDHFQLHYTAADGTLQALSIGTADNEPAVAPLMPGTEGMTDWRDNFTLLRLLAQSYARWPNEGRLADLRLLSDEMLRQLGTGPATDFNAAVPTPEPSLDPGATPTPKPQVTAQPTIPEIRLEVMRLASPDLFIMQQLARFDDRWLDIGEKAAAVVAGGLVSDLLPLYAFAYDPEQQGYLPFAGDVPIVDTYESLLTILHLAEIGRENPRSLSWIRDQIYNQQIIYEAYHIAQGQAASENECVAAYALVARIARIKGDQALYQAALDLLLWHQATSVRSEALSAIYRQYEDGSIRVWASDNTWALAAIG